MEERRGSPRYKISQLIGYFPGREEYLWAEGLDISRGGLSCRSKAPVDPLTNVFVMVSVPGEAGEHLVRCEGYVTNSLMDGEYCRFGIKIEHVSPEDKPYLDALILKLDVEKEEERAES
jgi:hypothetical protein